MSARTPRLLVLVGTLVLSLGWAASVRAQAPPETIEYYATDALGSVRVVFTPTGQVLGRSAYLPFGDTLDQSGSLPRQRFTGQERDGEAGLDYFNARSLQVRTGRMSSPDPLFGGALENPQRWNRYAYAANNPLRFVDPTGEYSEDDDEWDWGDDGWGDWDGGWGDVTATVGYNSDGILTFSDTIRAPLPSIPPPPPYPSFRDGNGDYTEECTVDNGCLKIGIVVPPAIGPYSRLRAAFTAAGVVGAEMHHIIEQRFYPNLVEEVGELATKSKGLAVALDPELHQEFTQLWRRAVPYGTSLAQDAATLARHAATIYADYPEIFQAAMISLGIR